MLDLKARNAAQIAQCELCNGLPHSLAALAKPSSYLQGCLPPLPGEALDRPREYLVRAAFSCGAAPLRNRENWGSRDTVPTGPYERGTHTSEQQLTAPEPSSIGARHR